ncbi:MAG: hypothetical protein NT139_01115, partial [Candidatus Woesearchaeota archaeon]|nr:hypothetical protein [Candidatus Woesearchaeota archaeon]
GFGALIGDLMIFSFIRLSFKDEINRISKERIFLYINRKIPKVMRKYIIPIFAGFLIASPLPDEIGVALLASSRNISIRLFSIISYCLNTTGIFILLCLSKII